MADTAWRLKALHIIGTAMREAQKLYSMAKTRDALA